MTKKISRNDPCTCGSGKKYKKCCGKPGMGRHTASVLDSTKLSGNLLGRISQAGEAFTADRKIDGMKKGITVGKLEGITPQGDSQAPVVAEDEKKSNAEEKND